MSGRSPGPEDGSGEPFMQVEGMLELRGGEANQCRDSSKAAETRQAASSQANIPPKRR